MASILTFLHGFARRNAITAVVRHARRPGIGFVLFVLLSMVFAVAAHAQTDGSESGPTLTITSSHATATKGEEVTFTLTASSPPTANILVNVQVTAQGPSLDETATFALSLAAGERKIELIMDTGTDSAVEGNVTVSVSILAGTGYSR